MQNLVNIQSLGLVDELLFQIESRRLLLILKRIEPPLLADIGEVSILRNLT
ncbi:hypothetical protein D3C75_1117220 [compost metagenome]